jgi:hypothetical protein
VKVLGVFDYVSQGKLTTPGIEFHEDEHKYYRKGKELSGITGVIGAKLGKKFPETFVEEHRGQGSHIHKAIEGYIHTGKEISVHPAARWAVSCLEYQQEEGYKLYSEVLVTDHKKYASAIDILAVRDDQIIIFDTKAGNFMRESVSWQLGVYQYFLEEMTNMSVFRCYCLATKDRNIYPIIPKSFEDVRRLLYK